jgi:geranylgeranyl diphosphate synthase, type III
VTNWVFASSPSNLVLINILKQKTTDEEVKRFAVRYLEEKGSFQYSAKVIGELRNKTEELISQIEQGLGEGGTEGAAGLRAVLAKLVIR